MDNLATILIILSIVGFILWVILHRDNESTAKQIYQTLKDIENRESKVTEMMLPVIIEENIQTTKNREYFRNLQLADFDEEKSIEQQIGNLMVGNTTLRTEKMRDKKLDSLHKRLNLLRGEMLDAQLENTLSEYTRIRQGVENITVGFRVMNKCFIIDMEGIKKLTSVIRKGNIKLQKLEMNIVKELSKYVKKDLPQYKEEKVYEYKL